jgi:hypothetical protein
MQHILVSPSFLISNNCFESTASVPLGARSRSKKVGIATGCIAHYLPYDCSKMSVLGLAEYSERTC